MTTEAYISNVSIGSYAGSHSGNMTISHGTGDSTNINLSKEECDAILTVCLGIFEARRHKIAQRVEVMKMRPLIGYNEQKTIEADDAPF